MHTVHTFPIAFDKVGSRLNAAVMHHGPMNRAYEIDSAPAGGACSITRKPLAKGKALRMAAVERARRPMAQR